MTTDTLHTHLRQGTAAYRRATLALFCAGFATFAMLYCVQPLLPLLAAHFAVSAATSSLALSLTTLCLALCLLVSGALAESWGRKPVMAAALGLASLLGLACVLVESWNLLLVLRALLGLALSGLPALAMAYVGEEFDPPSLPAAMGLYIGGTALGGCSVACCRGCSVISAAGNSPWAASPDSACSRWACSSGCCRLRATSRRSRSRFGCCSATSVCICATPGCAGCFSRPSC